MGLTRKQVEMVCVLIFGTFIAVLDQTLMTPAMASIMKEMQVGTTTVQWLTTGFTMVNAIMIPVTAFLIERFSTRALYMGALGVFAAGSLIAGWGPSFGILLAGRMIQASGAGIVMPLVMTVLMLTFPSDKRGSAMGIFSLVIAFAPAVGPSLAGLVIDHAGWHAMLYIVTVLSTLAIILAFFFLTNVGEQNRAAKLDKPSVIMSSLGLIGLLYGCSTIGSEGVNPLDLVITVAGVLVVALFVHRQLRLEKPMLELRVFTSRKFLTSAVIAMLVQATLFAGGMLMPIYLQTYRGFSATVSGLVILPGALLMGALGPWAGRVFDKNGPRRLVLTGTAALTFSSLGFFMLHDNTPIALIVVLYTIRMGSIALVNMPTTTWGMNALDNKLISHGTSVNNTLRMVAGSLGTAVLVSVSSAVSSTNVGSMSAADAGITGINAAFGVAAAMCAAVFVLVLLFVKDKPGDAAGADPDNARRTVLESIMKREVYTLPDTATVTDAMQLFVDHGVSAVPVVNAEGIPVGFVSDGDILRFLSKGTGVGIAMNPTSLITLIDPTIPDFGARCEELAAMHVADIAEPSVVSVDVHADLPEVCRVLGENHLKKVPVLDGGKLVGVINRSDITHYAMETYLANESK